MKLTDLYLKPEEIDKLVEPMPQEFKLGDFADIIAKASANHAVKKVVEYLVRHSVLTGAQKGWHISFTETTWEALKKLVEEAK